MSRLGRTVPQLGFADRLLIARRHAGVEQEEVCAKVGVSRQAYSAWENGHSRPRDVDRIQRLAAILRVPFAWLAVGEDGTDR